MNFVALALLEACGGNDENAFWILAGMCENLELEVNILSRFIVCVSVVASSGLQTWFCTRGHRLQQASAEPKVATVALRSDTLS